MGRSLLGNTFWIPDFDTNYDTWFKPKIEIAQIYMNNLSKFNFKLKNDNFKVIIRCERNYNWFPFDTQNCSHAYILDANPSDIQVIYDPAKILQKSFIHQNINPDWYISLEIRNVFVSTKNNKQILPLNLIIQRKISVHILHLFVPSIMLCIASMASLFIPQDYVPGRMSLVVTSCLSMITLFIAAKYVRISFKQFNIWNQFFAEILGPEVLESKQ